MVSFAVYLGYDETFALFQHVRQMKSGLKALEARKILARSPVELTVNGANNAVRKAVGVNSLIEPYCFGVDFMADEKTLNPSEEIRICPTKNGSRNSKTAGK